MQTKITKILLGTPIFLAVMANDGLATALEYRENPGNELTAHPFEISSVEVPQLGDSSDRSLVEAIEKLEVADKPFDEYEEDGMVVCRFKQKKYLGNEFVGNYPLPFVKNYKKETEERWVRDDDQKVSKRVIESFYIRGGGL